MRHSAAVGDLKYQRTIIGYHGCDESVVRDVLLRGRTLRPSDNDYDWLGRGIYFWEHGPRRAYEWAQNSKKVTKPAVIGAHINLGYCFDLLDIYYTQLLTDMFPLYRRAYGATGTPLPTNLSPKNHDSGDLLLRHLDCSAINWCLDFLERQENQHFHTVRCLFSEGTPVFEGSKILSKSHIQIAVRDIAAVVGYFKPQIDK
jgi:hypothetical protein